MNSSSRPRIRNSSTWDDLSGEFPDQHTTIRLNANYYNCFTFSEFLTRLVYLRLLDLGRQEKELRLFKLATMNLPKHLEMVRLSYSTRFQGNETLFAQFVGNLATSGKVRISLMNNVRPTIANDLPAVVNLSTEQATAFMKIGILNESSKSFLWLTHCIAHQSEGSPYGKLLRTSIYKGYQQKPSMGESQVYMMNVYIRFYARLESFLGLVMFSST